MAQEPIDLFVDKLITESGLNLPPDYREQYVERLKEQINNRLGAVIIENLDQAGMEEFTQLMQQQPQPDINTIQSMFSSRIPNFDEKIREAMIGFAQEFIAAAK